MCPMLKIDFITKKDVPEEDVELVLDTIKKYGKKIKFRHLDADSLSEEETSELQEQYGVYIIPLIAIGDEKTYNGTIPSDQELEAKIEQKLKPSEACSTK